MLPYESYLGFRSYTMEDDQDNILYFYILRLQDKKKQRCRISEYGFIY